MRRPLHTTCWGLVAALVLLFPSGTRPASASGNARPVVTSVPPGTQAAPAPPGAPAPPPSPPGVSGPRPPVPVRPSEVPTAAADAAPYVRAWSQSLDPAGDLSLAVGTDVVIVADASGMVVGRAAATGLPVWTRALAGITSLEADGTEAFALAAGQVLALDITTGQSRWTAAVTTDARWMALTATRVLVSGGQEIAALDRGTGQALWRVRVPAPAATRVTGDDQLAVVAMTDTSLVAVHMASGAEAWRRSLDAVPLAVLVRDARVVVALPSYAACVFSATSGRKAWCAHVRIPAVGAPLMDDQGLHVALFDGTLRSFGADSAEMRIQGLGGRPAGGPLVSADRLAIPLATGEVVFVDPIRRRTTRLRATPGVAALLQGAHSTPDGGLVVTLSVAPDGSRIVSAFHPTGATPPSPPTP